MERTRSTRALHGCFSTLGIEVHETWWPRTDMHVFLFGIVTHLQVLKRSIEQGIRSKRRPCLCIVDCNETVLKAATR